jgi:hypothetical protein
MRTFLLGLILGTLSLGGAVAQSTVGSAGEPAGTMPQSAVADTNAPDSSGASERERGGDECLGFTFGEWTPSLDAKAAGHPAFPPAASLPQAPGGRDWAVDDTTARDMQLLLYPSWWPAGVRVRFPNAPRTPRDTVRGMAFALVADGNVRSPEAKVMAWLVPCRR